MDIIKAIEHYSYYHELTGESPEQWEAWREETIMEWRLDKRKLDYFPIVEEKEKPIVTPITMSL